MIGKNLTPQTMWDSITKKLLEHDFRLRNLASFLKQDRFYYKASYTKKYLFHTVTMMNWIKDESSDKYVTE